MTDTKKLDGRVALITGASRGIGRAVALRFAREGAHVIATARTKGALEELDDEIRSFGGGCTLVPMDLGNGEKVDGLGPAIYERWGHLDILVANGAMLGPLSPLTHVGEKDFLKVLTTNLTANWRLVRTLDPLLQRSEAGRAIFVTSNAAAATKAYWGPYSISKAGLEALVTTYANEIATTNVKANLLNPGRVATHMRAAAFPGEDPEPLAKPEMLTDLFVKMVSADYLENGARINFSA